MAYAQILQRLLQRFFQAMGRAPSSAAEWSKLRRQAMELAKKEEGIPSITKNTTLQDLMTGPHMSDGPKGQRIWDFSKDLPTKDVLGKSADIIPFPKQKSRTMTPMSGKVEDVFFDHPQDPRLYKPGIQGLMKKGDLTRGTAPKTTPEHLKAKKDRGILLRDADEDILRIKRENKEAIERFKKKMNPDEPDKFQYGGIAPLVGEPSYAANFYDDRTPMEEGGMTQEDFNQFLKEREEGYHEGSKRELEKDWERYKRFKKYGPGSIREAAQGGRIGMKVGRIVKGIKTLLKKKKPKVKKDRLATADELEEYRETLDPTGEAYIVEEGMTVGHLDGLVKEHKAYERHMFLEYKKGNLDPTAGDKSPARKEFLEKKLEEMEMSGDKRLMTRDEIEELSSFDLGTEMDAAVKKPRVHTLDERTMLKQKYPGLTDDLLDKILIDDNPQRKAEVLATMDEYLKLRQVGKGEEEAFDIMVKSIKDPIKHAKGGRAEFIFGGSAGLRAMWKKMMQGINKGRDKPITKLFPKLSARDREMEKLVMGTPEQKAFREGEEAHKLEGIDLLINRLKHDKKIIERQAKNKAMKDEGLDFVMKHLEETAMPDVFGPHLKKYTDIDKDILQMENIKKNLIMKDRKLNADGGRIEMGAGGITKLLKGFLKKKPKPKSNKLSEQDVVALKKKHGLDPESLKKDDEAFKLRLQQILAKHSTKHADGGRVSYSGGGRAGLPAITYGTPQMNMQGPQMPAGPQPAGIPGGTIVAQNQMQQAPWMGSQMQQGSGGMPRPQPGGMPRPQPGGMPRPMAAEGGRIGYAAGGFNAARRAFMKMMAGITAGGIAAGTGILKLGKAAKVVPKVTETIVQSNAAGMPAWFPSLVKRVIKEGEDISGKAGSEAMERQTVHTIKLPESGTPVQVTRDLVTDDIIVDIGEQTKHGWSAGRHGQPTQLILKKGEWIEPTKGKKGIKTKDEFMVDEAEFTGGHPENVKFEESVQFKYGDHGSDFSEIEQFATKKSSFSGDSVGEVSRSQRREGWYGKKEQAHQLKLDKKYGGLKSTYKKDPHVRGKQADKDAWAEGRAESQAEDIDFASGGLARMLGE